MLVLNECYNVIRQKSSGKEEDASKHEDLFGVGRFLIKNEERHNMTFEEYNRTSSAFRHISPPFTGGFRKVSRELWMSRRALAIHRRASEDASGSSL